MTQISLQLYELAYALEKLIESVGSADERSSLRESQRKVQQCTSVDLPRYVCIPTMQLEISQQIRWLEVYQDAIAQGLDEEILERYSEEALKGAEGLAAAFDILQDDETNSWKGVSRRRPMPRRCIGNSTCAEMFDCDEEYESTNSEVDESCLNTKFWYF
jgi:hypothetical protein